MTQGKMTHVEFIVFKMTAHKMTENRMTSVKMIVDKIIVYKMTSANQVRNRRFL
jgi:hypothetical protein